MGGDAEVGLRVGDVRGACASRVGDGRERLCSGVLDMYSVCLISAAVHAGSECAWIFRAITYLAMMNLDHSLYHECRSVGMRLSTGVVIS